MNAAAPLASSAHAFQYTPFGIIPLGAAIPTDAGVTEPAPAASPRAAPMRAQTEIAVSDLHDRNSAPPPKTDKPVTGKQLAAAAKARIRELDKYLAAVPAVEAERAGLARLLDAYAAAPTKRPAKVVSLRASGRSGDE
jgi:hypothetical protein